MRSMNENHSNFRIRFRRESIRPTDNAASISPPPLPAPTTRTIQTIFLNNKHQIKQEYNGSVAKFAGIAENSVKIVVVNTHKQHLQQHGGAADKVADDHPGSLSVGGLQPEIEPQLWREFNDAGSSFDGAENVDAMEPREGEGSGAGCGAGNG